jgi:hypothetical protein
MQGGHYVTPFAVIPILFVSLAFIRPRQTSQGHITSRFAGDVEFDPLGFALSMKQLIYR